ncbi:MTH1187 family thiamine-binding protein [Haloterrigena sp. SYSU A558-1]|uniref:MTH1187 family thiamine-binding protein n=1 Tax=Haloterrigena gelatinilytica TaxID=2741724 RepID=A0A8J8KIP1_9EURY|nr:MTH1187 family thiamine-binding protein [Haloterrigena gelatinilytica]NUB92489.1 MTH1187 family thiamine-binding protein [Haloterrigena gelatinilytica]NUC71594.1 MTH1187 family thiamine-binding protein [Haloterrigena gelatinilytica]
MTVIALLSVAPVIEGSMSGEVAKAVDALEAYDVEYETNPMGTVIEADDVGELFAAAQAAHEAVDGDRVSTVLKIDDKRSRDASAEQKVEAVEEHLGRPATNRDESDDETEAE